MSKPSISGQRSQLINIVGKDDVAGAELLGN